MARYELGETENKILSSIYEAALKPEQWQAVLLEIAHHIGADETFLSSGVQNSPSNFLTAVTSTVPDQSIEAADIKLLENDQLITNAELESVTICSALVTLGRALEVAALPKNNMTGLITGFYDLIQSSTLSPEAIDFLYRLTPHLIRAACIHNEICTLKHQNHSLVESLKRTNLGVFLLDAELQVVFVTPEAERILQTNPCLQINRFRQLNVHDSSQQIELEMLLRTLLGPASSPTTLFTQEVALPLHHPDKVHPLKINAIALTDNSPFNSSAIRLAVFINDPLRPRLIPQQYLQQAFAFTRTEAYVAQLLLNGSSIAEIAAARNTSLETTRWQIKSLMQKTNTNSQAEIMRLLMALSDEFLDDSNAIQISP